jgi:hypothetical protein
LVVFCISSGIRSGGLGDRQVNTKKFAWHLFPFLFSFFLLTLKSRYVKKLGAFLIWRSKTKIWRCYDEKPFEKSSFGNFHYSDSFVFYSQWICFCGNPQAALYGSGVGTPGKSVKQQNGKIGSPE